MPTFNQLVRKGRETSMKKSTAPALQISFNGRQFQPITLNIVRKGFIMAIGTMKIAAWYKYHAAYFTWIVA